MHISKRCSRVIVRQAPIIISHSPIGDLDPKTDWTYNWGKFEKRRTKER